MREIALTNGGVALVDDADYEALSAHAWARHALGYACRWVRENGRTVGCVYMHRQIMGEPDSLVDHINRDKLDNRRANLRNADKSINAHNAGPLRNNTSGHRGVDFDKSRGKWMARIKVRGKLHHLGRFDTLADAVAARAVAESRLINQ